MERQLRKALIPPIIRLSVDARFPSFNLMLNTYTAVATQCCHPSASLPPSSHSSQHTPHTHSSPILSLSFSPRSVCPFVPVSLSLYLSLSFSLSLARSLS